MTSIVELTSYGILRISGADATKFLQGQLTCDVTSAANNPLRLGAHCNQQGRIVSLFRIAVISDQYFLLMTKNLIPVAMSALKKYAVFFKVQLEDASDAFKLYGSDEASVCSGVFAKISESPLRYLMMTEKTLSTNTDENVWKHQDIVEKIPAIYAETSGKFLPHELNLPALDAVCFKKGCYTGQEIIARMQYRGKMKTQLVAGYLKSDAAPERYADVYRDGGVCGNIVDRCEVGVGEYAILFIAPLGDEKGFSVEGDNSIIMNR